MDAGGYVTSEMFTGLAIGIALLAGYVWLGVFCIRRVFALPSNVDNSWVRALLASIVAVLFFMPGLVGGGHGAGIGPAWLMIATGTFAALTAASKQTFVIALTVVWGITFSIAMLIARRRSKN
jgi:hypothetical protein